MNATDLSQLTFRPVRRPTALNFVHPLIVADLAEGVGFRTKGPVLAQRLALVRPGLELWVARHERHVLMLGVLREVRVELVLHVGRTRKRDQ